MSGKKQSQRTKNNARPSSSSRSAELLNHSMSFDGGLMTISGGKVLPALFPTLAAVNIDQGLKPEYQMCIKKLSKKDPITRAKALQELCELVNNGNVDDAVAVLPAWAHCYKTLTFDTDRKVREMTQLCHGALVRMCGRRTAPHLKALLPPWLQAQYDEHAPAMAHAQNSLMSTFPDSKLPDAISFCKSEVMAHLLENLIGNTESIISKKLDEEDLFLNYPINVIESPDERELQMCRIITGSLRGLEYFVPQLPAAHHEWLWAELAPLLAADAYWKMSTHNMHLVRAAWFGVTGRVVERFAAQFAERLGARALRLLLAAPRGTHALVAAQLWTCLLQFMHNVPDWQKYLDKKELLIKRILDVLEAGGWGDARHLSTMLLPLLAHLPRDVLTKEFYEKFFNAIYKGFEKKNIITSKSERQSWITSLAECLRYLSIQENDFVVEVVTSVHRTWLEKTLSTQHDSQTRNNLIKCSVTNMTSLVKYWLKQSNEGKSEKYDQLLRNFWQNIGSTLLTQIDKCSTDLVEIEMLIDAHILLLQSLKTTFSQETKKQLSIKFEKSVDDDKESVVSDGPAANRQCDATAVDRYEHNLDELVHKVIAHYFEAAEKKEAANAILTPVITLLSQFDSADAYRAVARRLGADSALGLYRRVLHRWLAGDTMRCKAVVDIIFLMIKYLKEDEQDVVFDSFRELTPGVTEWCLARSVAHPHVRVRAARRWLRSGAAARALAGLARRAARHRDSAAAHLLLVCLADPPDSEPLFSEEAVSEMMRTVSSTVAAVDEVEAKSEDETEGEGEGAAHLEFGGRLAARLVTALAPAPSRALMQPFSELVLHLLRLNVLVPRGDARLPTTTWCEVRSSWLDGLAALDAPARTAFLQDAVQLFTTHIFKNIEILDVQKIEDTVSLAPYLFIRGDESQLPDDLTEIITFTKQMFNMDTKESLAVETCALRHECVTSQLNCLYEDNDVSKIIIEGSAETEIQELSKSDATVYMNKLLFRAIYLRTMLLHKAVSEDDADDNDATTWCDTLLKSEYLETEFCKMLYDYTIVVSLNEAYTFWPDYSIIEETKLKMDAVLSDIISASSEASRQKIVTSLKELATAKGYYWAYAHRYYSVSARRGDDGVSLRDSDEKIEEPSTSAHLHMMQACNKFGDSSDSEFRTAFLVMFRSFQERHCQELTSELLEELEASKASCNIGVILKHYCGQKCFTLFDEKLPEASWSAVVNSASIADVLRLTLDSESRLVPWTFINPMLHFLFRAARKSLDRWGSVKFCMVMHAALRLLDAALRAQERGPAPPSPPAPPAPPGRGPYGDWSQYESDLYDVVYFNVSNVLNNKSRCMTVPQSTLLGGLIGALGGVDWHRSGRSREPYALRRLGHVAARAMMGPAHPAYRHLAHALLRNLAKPLVYDDAQEMIAWSESEEERVRPANALDAFNLSFGELQQIVDTTLNNVVLGEEVCELVSMSDSHSLVLGWLLLADAQAHMWELASGDLKQIYVHIYTKHNYAGALLAAALRLVPGALLAWARAGADKLPAPPAHAHMFLSEEPFRMRAACDSRGVQALACRCVARTVCGAGCGGARSWRGVAPPRAAHVLERLVVAYVAPAAVAEQFEQLQRRAREIDDAEVRISWSTREVVCEYRVEDSTVELHLWLSRAHPLTPPRLEAPGFGGAATAPWLALYLTYQVRTSRSTSPTRYAPRALPRLPGTHLALYLAYQVRTSRSTSPTRYAPRALPRLPGTHLALYLAYQVRTSRSTSPTRYAPRALPHLPERHAVQRSEDLDAGGERARGEGPAVLHLLLPPAPHHGPPAQRHVPPVQEQVPQHLRAQMVQHEQQVQLPAVPSHLLTLTTRQTQIPFKGNPYTKLRNCVKFK
ncbi:unnamed protein product [Arctia plantaginis]|uniref:E3 ubiquitin-protein ligase listerin n=1 Tax=Arctia plantaginis TaxID=874455 RepID=A0A8S0ZYY2_ARCPL|nr:unnamed protein product [Arctia plantaginis]